VASEVLYYFPREEMLTVMRGFERELAPGGILLAVHWRRKTEIYPLQGDEVHELLVEHSRLLNKETVVEANYRLDVFEDGT
jgi:hypothetical protein